MLATQRVPVHGITSALFLSVLAFFLPPLAVSCKMGYCPSMECTCAAILCAIGVRARGTSLLLTLACLLLPCLLTCPSTSPPSATPCHSVHPWLCVRPHCGVVLAAPAQHLNLLCACCHCHSPAHILPAGRTQGGPGIAPSACLTLHHTQVLCLQSFSVPSTAPPRTFAWYLEDMGGEKSMLFFHQWRSYVSLSWCGVPVSLSPAHLHSLCSASVRLA